MASSYLIKLHRGRGVKAEFMQEDFELVVGVASEEPEALPTGDKAQRKGKSRGKGKAFKHFKQGQRKKDTKQARRKGKS